MEAEETVPATMVVATVVVATAVVATAVVATAVSPMVTVASITAVPVMALVVTVIATVAKREDLCDLHVPLLCLPFSQNFCSSDNTGYAARAK
jgi:hypothetical protein